MPVTPKKIYWISFAFWLLSMLIHLACYLSRAIVAMPTDEIYANSLTFQVVAFGITKLPFWLLGLAPLLLLESFLFRRR